MQCGSRSRRNRRCNQPLKQHIGGQLTRKGRARCVSPIFALTQRPAESDKTAIGNATLFRTGRLKRADDRKMVAKELDVHVSEVTGLKPLDFVERDDVTGKVTRGNLRKHTKL